MKKQEQWRKNWFQFEMTFERRPKFTGIFNRKGVCLLCMGGARNVT